MAVNGVDQEGFSAGQSVVLGKLRVPERLLWPLAVAGLLLVCWLAFGWQLGRVGLIDETEPKFAEAARQMLRTGDWITPTFNGEPRFDKPPLIYWLMLPAFGMVGVNEWGVRLPSALAGTGLVLLVFWALRTFTGSWQAAWVGGLATALSPLSLIWSRIGTAEMLLCLLIAGSLLAFFVGYARQSPTAYVSFYGWMALGTLTKGPVAIVLPVLTILLFLGLVGNWRAVLRELKPLRGCLILVLLTLPWYLAVTAINGEAFIDSFFGHHNFDRFVSVVDRHDNRTAVPVYFYWLVSLVGFLPWSPFLPLAVARLRVWQWRQWRERSRGEQLGLFALCWVVAVLAFFSLAVTKRVNYVLPLLPALSLLLGLLWADQTALKGRGFQGSALVASGVCALLAVLSLHSLRWLPEDPWLPDLPATLARQRVDWWGALLAGAMAGVGMLGVSLGRRRGSGLWLPLTYSLGCVGLIALTILPAMATVDLQRQLPLRQLAASVAQYQQMHPDRETSLVALGPVIKPSVVFYARQNVKFLQVSKKFRVRYLSQPHPDLLVLGSEKDLRLTQLRSEEYKLLASAGVYRLVRIDAQANAR